MSYFDGQLYPRDEGFDDDMVAEMMGGMRGMEGDPEDEYYGVAGGLGGMREMMMGRGIPPDMDPMGMGMGMSDMPQGMMEDPMGMGMGGMPPGMMEDPMGMGGPGMGMGGLEDALGIGGMQPGMGGIEDMMMQGDMMGHSLRRARSDVGGRRGDPFGMGGDPFMGGPPNYSDLSMGPPFYHDPRGMGDEFPPWQGFGPRGVADPDPSFGMGGLNLGDPRGMGDMGGPFGGEFGGPPGYVDSTLAAEMMMGRGMGPEMGMPPSRGGRGRNRLQRMMSGLGGRGPMMAPEGRGRSLFGGGRRSSVPDLRPPDSPSRQLDGRRRMRRRHREMLW